jgi:orotate phosphoribosyltransferase-like protein
MRKNIDWTPEMIATACGMKRAGIKMQTIADRLGVSKTAVAHATLRKGSYSTLNKGASGRFKKPSRMLNLIMMTQDETDKNNC